MKIITAEMREQLRKPLPKEAISQHPTKTFLSTIKAIYVVERLNDVFGVGNWKTKTEVITTKEIEKKNPMVIVKSVLTINYYNIEIEAFGGNDNADLGDAYKGAATDALTKIGSYLEIGIDVFKGLADKIKAPKNINTLQNKAHNLGQKVLIAHLLKEKMPKIKTAEDYKEACMTITGFELLPANYETIINFLK
jgi:hypothetical protein